LGHLVFECGTKVMKWLLNKDKNLALVVTETGTPCDNILA